MMKMLVRILNLKRKRFLFEHYICINFNYNCEKGAIVIGQNEWLF